MGAKRREAAASVQATKKSTNQEITSAGLCGLATKMRKKEKKQPAI